MPIGDDGQMDSTATAPEQAEPGDATLAAYQSAADEYLTGSARPAPSLLAYLDRFAELVGDGPVLEIGSGPGWDADHLESRGTRVERTDATPAFVDRLRRLGHEARLLDARTDELGGPYAGLIADAVLLHLSRAQCADFLVRARTAVVPGGVLAFTLKQGDGEGWSDRKLSVARHFTYWRPGAVRELLKRSGWEVLRLDEADGRTESWLYCLARRASSPTTTAD